MAELRIGNVAALGQPLGMLAPGADVEAQCAGVFAQIGGALTSAGAGWGHVVHFPGGAYPPNTLLVVDRLVQEQFLIEVQTVAAL